MQAGPVQPDVSPVDDDDAPALAETAGIQRGPTHNDHQSRFGGACSPPGGQSHLPTLRSAENACAVAGAHAGGPLPARGQSSEYRTPSLTVRPTYPAPPAPAVRPNPRAQSGTKRALPA